MGIGVPLVFILVCENRDGDDLVFGFAKLYSFWGRAFFVVFVELGEKL